MQSTEIKLSPGLHEDPFFFSMTILACIPKRKHSSLEPDITALPHVTNIKINSVYLCLLMRVVWLGQRRNYTA